MSNIWTFLEGGNKEKNLDRDNFDDFHNNTAIYNFLFDLLKSQRLKLQTILNKISFFCFIWDFCLMAWKTKRIPVSGQFWPNRGQMEINNFSVFDSEVRQSVASDGCNFTWRSIREVVWASIINIECPFKSTSDMNHGHTNQSTNKGQWQTHFHHVRNAEIT